MTIWCPNKLWGCNLCRSTLIITLCNYQTGNDNAFDEPHEDSWFFILIFLSLQSLLKNFWYISYTAWKSNTCCASFDFSKHSSEEQAVCQGYREAIYILEVDSEFELFRWEIIYCSDFAIHTSFFFNINYLTERGFWN